MLYFYLLAKYIEDALLKKFAYAPSKMAQAFFSAMCRHLYNCVKNYVHECCSYCLASCINGSMHLVGPDGSNTVEGRVEYCSNGLWGTVYDGGFDSRDGEVVCRRLGYQHPRKILST